MSAKVIACLARSPANMKCPLSATFRQVTVKVQKSNIFKVCVQSIPHVLKCKLEDVNTAAWLLHRWPSGWSDPTLWSDATFLGDIMKPAAVHTPAASPRSGSLLGLGQDCWLARELERWSLVLHRLTVAQSHTSCEQEQCPVSERHLWTSDCSHC